MDEELFPGGYLALVPGTADSKGEDSWRQKPFLVSAHSVAVCKSTPSTGTLTGRVK